MTPEQLQAIRARLDAATPGTWTAKHEGVNTDLGEWGLVAEALTNTEEGRAADALFISHAPTDLRALLDEVERLKAEKIKQFRQGAELMQSAILYILHDYNIDPQAIADIVQMDYPVRPEDWAKRPRSET